MTEITIEDVQGIALNGYGSCFDHARHFALGIGRGAAARRFIALLLDGDHDTGLAITTGARWPDDTKPESCLNIGFTWAGLKALGLPAGVLDDFPPAFREGPALRARTSVASDLHVGLGDVRESAPEHWTMGGPDNPEIHVIVSLYTQGADRFDTVSDRLRSAFSAHLLRERWHGDARSLSGKDRVHFGYRDGIGQPRLPGGHGNKREDMQPDMPAGDLLLGCDYENSFKGNFAGDLPRALADNATYGAFRVLYQDVAAFERLLTAWSQETGLPRETVAAKLAGRWRSGTVAGRRPGAARRPARRVRLRPEERRSRVRRHRGLPLPHGSPRASHESPRGTRHGRAPQPAHRPSRHAVRARAGGGRPRRRDRPGHDRLLPVRRPRDAVGVPPADLRQRRHRDVRHPGHA
jgi:hypothetical protein